MILISPLLLFFSLSGAQHLVVIFISLLFVFSLNAAELSPIDEFTTANNLFTQSVYKEIVKSRDGNFLVSPFSAETVLAFAQSGAKDESAEELRNALHLSKDKDRVESAIKTLIPKFKSNGLYSLHTANKMYIRKNFTIKERFKHAASEVYHANIENIDFRRSIQAADSINGWVEKHTENKIKNLISSDDLDQFTRALLVNALYFKANWSKPFQLSSTLSRDFHKSENESVKVNFLHHYEDYFKYYDSPELKAQFLELPFKGGEASMVVALPNEKDGLASLENSLDKVIQSRHQLKRQFLNVALPKFKIESSTDFAEILKKLGVHKVFDEDKADLSNIAGIKGDLFIKRVAQKAFIDVSEEGVEAAAATFVLIPIPESIPVDRPKEFTADRPFIFYIKIKDLIIFTGRVTDPSKL